MAIPHSGIPRPAIPPADATVGELTASSATITALTATSANLPGFVRGATDRQYRTIQGVIRPDGAGGWVLLDDANHRNSLVASVSVTSTYVRVAYGVTAAKVVSMSVTPDETMASLGYTVGASAGLTYADITISRSPRVIGGYVSYNGSSWVVALQNGALTVNSFGSAGSGVLRLFHEAADAGLVSAVGRPGSAIPLISSVNETTTDIVFYDWAGNLITAANTSMRVFLQRHSAAVPVVNPVTAGIPTTGNIWIDGTVEVE